MRLIGIHLDGSLALPLAPLWLRFNASGRTLYFSLGVHLAPRLWNPRARRVRKGHPHANEIIERRLADAEREQLRLLAEREPVTAEALKAAAAGETGGNADFFGYVDAFHADLRRRGEVRRVKTEDRARTSRYHALATAHSFGRPVPALSETAGARAMIEEAVALAYKAIEARAILNVIANNRAFGNAPALDQTVAFRFLEFAERRGA